jgi:hypothetical protein
MFYTVYKITNTLNGKYYIGKHKTSELDDGYMGSGVAITLAIKKYGIQNFLKEILHVFDNEDDMNRTELELVIISESTYNLCPGGNGGFPAGASEKGIAALNVKRKDLTWANTFKENRKRALKQKYGSSGVKSFLGRKHSEESKRKTAESMSGKQVGNKNSQFGTKWITNGSINKKIRNTEIIPDGWYSGRN